jgi:hypothetical protein
MLNHESLPQQHTSFQSKGVKYNHTPFLVRSLDTTMFEQATSPTSKRWSRQRGRNVPRHRRRHDGLFFTSPCRSRRPLPYQMTREFSSSNNSSSSSSSSLQEGTSRTLLWATAGLNMPHKEMLPPPLTGHVWASPLPVTVRFVCAYAYVCMCMCMCVACA